MAYGFWLYQGDSGGSLTVEEEDGHTLVGVVSHGVLGGCTGWSKIYDQLPRQE